VQTGELKALLPPTVCAFHLLAGYRYNVKSLADNGGLGNYTDTTLRESKKYDLKELIFNNQAGNY
jgi:hypothetical protein